MVKKFAIHQPNYLPWWGYFAKIAAVDYFVFLDHVEFPKGKSFTSRVKFRQQNLSTWLTIPVEKSKNKPIREVVFLDNGWRRKHKRSLYLNYKNTKYGNLWMDFVQSGLDKPTQSLAELNIHLIKGLSSLCGFKATFMRSSNLQLQNRFDSESIAQIAHILGARSYVSGRGVGSTKKVDCEYLNHLGIDVTWLDNERAIELLGGGVIDQEKNLTFLDTLSFNGNLN